MLSYRKNFNRSPDLIVNIGNSYDHKKIIILRENLNRYPILYDSALDFIKWFYINYDSYFLIEKKGCFIPIQTVFSSWKFLTVRKVKFKRRIA
jgi:hypothetical protein